MSTPILARPIRWQHLRPIPTAEHCALCRRPLGSDDASCERCGVPLHFTCWLRRLASSDERTIFMCTLEEEVARLVLFCAGCRS
jgi:predicted amidophosphoribosyltransferase